MVVLALLLLAMVLPFLARTWKSWGALCLVSLGLSIMAGAAMASPGFLSNVPVAFAALFTAPAAMGRATGLWAGTRFADFSALPLFAAVLMLPKFFDWTETDRPPKARCDTFPVTLGNIDFDLPLHASIMIAEANSTSSLSFTDRSRLRTACQLVDFGRERLPVRSVEFRFWVRWACEPIASLPFQDIACSPDRDRLSRTQLFSTGATFAPRLSESDRITWRNETARCFPQAEDRMACNAIDEISPGLSAEFSFATARGHEAEALERVRAAIAQTITSLRSD